MAVVPESPIKDNKWYGRIDFTVGCDVAPEFKKAVSEVEEQDWHPLYKGIGGEVWLRQGVSGRRCVLCPMR